jgi:molecular chaperone HtpG
MTKETLNFQAEVSRLLDIVANSLYSNKEIFLRELISNGSDACDRLRYAAITQPELSAEDPDFKISLTVDKDGRKLTIADNGIGMNRDEMVDNLGTIARSGTAAFVEDLEAAKRDVNQIGQFGVGFYSAFMVADRVQVESRKAGEAEGWRWTSDGKGEFTVVESEEAPARGTAITLHLKKKEAGYLEAPELKRIVQAYSDHIEIPIVLAGEGDGESETLNQASAIWARPKSEISDEQYKEFYHHVGHTFDEPWLRLHFKVEGKIEYTGLLFIPSAKPFDLFHPERSHRIRLYVKRVFVTDECEGLMPSYLRFLRGVVDTEDLPLNISRELLQSNPLLAKIRATVIKRVLGELKKKAAKAPADYAQFWNNFGAVLKEGIYEDESQRDTLLALARFNSTRKGPAPESAETEAVETESAETGLISLDDYVGALREGQDAIYYIAGDDREALERSPQIEGFRAKGIEVLLLTDPVDEFWLSAVGAFQDKPFKSVTRGGADLEKIQAETAKDDDDKTTEPEDTPPALDALVAFVKLALKDEVKDVRASNRLTESPVCLVADEGDMDMHLERMLKQHRQIDQTSQRILEINPQHGLIRRLADRVGQDGAASQLEEAAFVLLDQARILEGEPLPDPSAFSRRLSRFVELGIAGE